MSFYQAIKHYFIILVCSMGFVACFNNDARPDCVQREGIDSYKEILYSCHKEGITIDAVDSNENKCVVRFSNNTGIILNDVSIKYIDIRDDNQQENIIYSGIIENYESWLFVFSDGDAVCINKSLFSINPDEIIKGINHRGYSVDAPENTLPAYRLSKLKGFTFVEADIYFTKDNIPVLIHDPKIDRTSNGTGYIKDLSWEEIRKLDFGQWKSPDFEGTKIPSLMEFLALCRDIGLSPYIELKVGTEEQVQEVVKLVDEYGLKEKTCYISFSPTLLQFARQNDPFAKLGYLTNSPLKDNAIQIAKGIKTDSNSVFIDSADYSQDAVQRCKEARLPLEVWTIDSESIIQSLSPYISGVTSNKYHAGRIRYRID